LNVIAGLGKHLAMLIEMAGTSQNKSGHDKGGEST
jgi:hypothetical protein